MATFTDPLSEDLYPKVDFGPPVPFHISIQACPFPNIDSATRDRIERKYPGTVLPYPTTILPYQNLSQAVIEDLQEYFFNEYENFFLKVFAEHIAIEGGPADELVTTSDEADFLDFCDQAKQFSDFIESAEEMKVGFNMTPSTSLKRNYSKALQDDAAISEDMPASKMVKINDEELISPLTRKTSKSSEVVAVESGSDSDSVTSDEDVDEEDRASAAGLEEMSAGDEIINFRPLNQKPSFKFESSSSIADRLPGFLAEMKAANEKLETDIAAGKERDYLLEIDDAAHGNGVTSFAVGSPSDNEDASSVLGTSSDNEDSGVAVVSTSENKDAGSDYSNDGAGDGHLYIEMNLGLGVLEENTGDVSENEDVGVGEMAKTKQSVVIEEL